MITQPDFVNDEVVCKAFEIAHKKKSHPLLEEITFGGIEDGLSVQMLHNGSYDDEPKSLPFFKFYNSALLYHLCMKPNVKYKFVY